MENYDVNRDKFLDLMAKHHLDAGVNVASSGTRRRRVRTSDRLRGSSSLTGWNNA